MTLVRLVCQAKFGKASEVVAVFKQSQEVIHRSIAPDLRMRIVTDLSGPFDTVIQELEVENLAAWERLRSAIFSNPQVQEVEAALLDSIESGQTEFYTIEATWPEGE